MTPSQRGLCSALALVLVAVCSVGVPNAQGEPVPPTGKRRSVPAATQIVVQDCTLVGQGFQASLRAGVPVRVAGRKDAWITVGTIEIEGRLNKTDLGLVVQRRVELSGESGGSGASIGEGARVRVIEIDGKQAQIETAGDVRLRGQIDADALGVQQQSPVLGGRTDVQVAKEGNLHPEASVNGKIRAKVMPGTWLEIIERRAPWVNVRTLGAVTIEGWIQTTQLGEVTPAVTAAKPTHEIFVTTTLYQQSEGKRVVGTIHGGVLLVAQPAGFAPTTRLLVETQGPIVIKAWVEKAQLRELEASVWQDGP